MKFRFEIEFQPYGEYYLAVPVGKKVLQGNEYIRINETSYFIALMVAKGKEIPEIIDEYQKTYSIDRELAENDVNCILGNLVRIGFIEE